MNLIPIILIGGLVALPASQGPERRIEVTVSARQIDSRVSSTSRPIVVSSIPTAIYVYTQKGTCDSPEISFSEPQSAAYGWRVDLTSRSGGINASWRRLWQGGQPSAEPGRNRTFESVDEVTATLDVIDTPLPSSAVVQRDVVVAHILDKIGRAQRMRQRLLDAGSGADREDRLRGIQTDIDELQRQLLARRGVLQARAGCAGFDLTLSTRAIVPMPAEPIFEISYWLVYTNPTGNEAVQHHVVRAQRPNPADVFFDDVVVKTAAGNLTVGVVARAATPNRQPDGTISMSTEVMRRYTSNGALPWASKEGTDVFIPVVQPGEVVSLALPPIPGDDSVLAGHRFSLRVRMTIVK